MVAYTWGIQAAHIKLDKVSVQLTLLAQSILVLPKILVSKDRLRGQLVSLGITAALCLTL